MCFTEVSGSMTRLLLQKLETALIGTLPIKSGRQRSDYRDFDTKGIDGITFLNCSSRRCTSKLASLAHGYNHSSELTYPRRSIHSLEPVVCAAWQSTFCMIPISARRLRCHW